MTLRDYQERPHAECVAKIKEYGLCYLAGQIRTGKSFISLSAMETLGKKNVLFVTTLKAKSSVEKDYNEGGFSFKLTLVNYESVHKTDTTYIDGVISDESHMLGQLGKPSLRTKKMKEVVGNKDLILMSGTPNAESLSQLYHQFWVHEKSPWAQCKNFFYWAACGYVHKYQIKLNGYMINRYERGDEKKIMGDVDKYMVKLSQEDASFECPVEENFVHLKMKDSVYELINKLQKEKVATVNGQDIVLDTPAKARMKFRQIFGGTVITEDGVAQVLDTTKIEYVREEFFGKKIAIYYYFDKEGELLRDAFPNWTDDQILFNKRDDLTFICQMKSGSKGVGLKTAEAMVLISVDDSAEIYFQIRGRMQDKERTTPAKIYWIFSEGGIEDKIYKNISRKKSYTTKYFQRDYGMIF